MSKLKVVEYYESKLFKDDEDFKLDNPGYDPEEIEKLKDNYYSGEFWNDCDRVYSKGVMIAWVVQIDNELIINRIEDNELVDLEKELINFYDNKIKDDFNYLDNGSFCSKEENKKLYNEMINSYIGIAFRGGQGYSYGFHCLKGYTTKDLLKDLVK